MTNKKDLLKKFHSFMKNESLDLFIVSSTDEYLNEYVSLNKNSRCILTGFSGSAGDAVITQNELFLFVDGRYHSQAEKQTDPALVTVVKVGLDKSPQKALYEKIVELSGKTKKIGIVSSKISCLSFKNLLKTLESCNKDVKIIGIPMTGDLEEIKREVIQLIKSI